MVGIRQLSSISSLSDTFFVGRDMNNLADRHFNLNRTLLMIVGLWPYRRSKLVRIQSICFFILLITSVILQLTPFVTTKCSTDLVTEVLTIVLAYTCTTIIYNSFCVNRETVKSLIEQLQEICDNLTNENEMAIIEKYGKNAKRYTTTLTTLYICCLFIISIGEFWPEFSNIILSGNKSRSRHFLITAKYFVVEEKYFYLLLLHVNVAGTIGVTAMLATVTMLVACLEHACGIFEIACYRIEQGIKFHILYGTTLLHGKFYYSDLIYAVDIHRKAMMFCKYLISKFETSFMFLIIFGVLTLSFNILRIFQVITAKYNTGEFLILLASVTLALTYMFLVNFVGQHITDHNNNVYATAYKVEWYETPIYVQKLILFLLQKGNKSFGLNVGRLFVASLECFATLVNASLSYFTIMYSV